MKLQYISDLHFEGCKKHLKNWEYLADNLVVAGDLHVGADNIIDSLNILRAKGYKHILFVFGNHEFYHNEFLTTIVKVQEAFKDDPVVHVLHRTTVTLEGVKFAGATLWTNFGNDWASEHQANQGITDFRVIQYKNDRFTTRHAANEFAQDVEFLFNENPDVVITHFLPALECINPIYAGYSTINRYFANDLAHKIADSNIKVWIHGHTHMRVDVTVGNTRIVANPAGYKHENKNDQVIEA